MKKPSVLILLTITITLTWIVINIGAFSEKKKNPHRIISWDVVSYYSYLPATFIDNDLSLSFLQDPKLEKKYRGQWKYWPIKTDNGNFVIKTTMGLSILYSPFFFIAHLLAEPFGFEASGFSPIYHLAIGLSTVFYTLLGLILVRKILINYFSEWLSSFGVILVLFGTNLFYFSAYQLGMPHPYSFFMIALFIFLMIKWSENPGWKLTVGIGIVIGLIALSRPTNVLITLIFPIYIFHKNDILYLIKNWKKLLLIALLGILVCFPQMLYWKTQTDMWIYNSYVGENFFFDNPHIISGLFSYRNGLFIYTPLMLFSIIGLFFIKDKKWSFSIALFLPVFLYVTYSWWCWWYGGSYGSRPIIDIYPLLIIPICYFIKYLIGIPKKGKALTFLFIFIFFSQGIFFTAKRHYSSIHYDGMNSKVYWNNFWRLYPEKGFRKDITRPDYKLAKEGKEEL